MEKIIKLNNTSLLIKNTIEEYDEIIENRITMFDESNNYENSILIENDKTIIDIIGKKEVINGKLVHTDLYQLINNVISNLINNETNIYIHSSVIRNDNNTIMILGDFNTGKTTLCREAEKNGYKILSADQSWLQYNTNLELHKGSLYMAYSDTYEIIDKIKENIKIDKILLLLGINDGTLKFYDNNNYYRNIKQLTKFATWSTNNILITDDIELSINKKVINDLIKKIDLPIVCASGKSYDIIKKMEEI